METILIEIADFVICVNFKPSPKPSYIPVFFKEKIKKEIIDYLKGYIINENRKPDFYIDFVEKTPLLKTESINSFSTMYYCFKSKKRIITYYHISLFQFQFIIKAIIARLFAGSSWFILHSSAVEKNGQSYIFTGNSGAGKSTAMSLLSNNKIYNAFSDDTSIIKQQNNDFYIYQTPFIEKNATIKKGAKRAKLKKVFFLKKSKYFKVERIYDKELISKTILNGIIAYSDMDMQKQANLAVKFIRQFNEFYFLYFSKDEKKLLNLFKNI